MTKTPLAAGVTLPQSTTLTLFALVAMYTCAMSATWPLVVLLCERLSITGAMQGVIYALAGAGQVLSGLFAGHACLKYGKRLVLNLSLASLSVAWVAVAVDPTFLALALAQVLTGFAAGTMVSASAYFGAHSSAQSRTKAFAWMLAFCGAGQLGGSALFSAGIAWGPQVVCYLVLGLSLTALLFSYFCLQDSVQAPSEELSSSKKESIWPVFRVARLQLTAYGLLFSTAPIVGIFTPIYAKAFFNATPAELSVLFSGIGVTMLIAPFCIKLLNRVMPERHCLTLGFVGVSAGALVCAMADSMGGLTAGFFMWCIFWDITAPYIKAAISRKVAPEQQALVGALESWISGALLMTIPVFASIAFAAFGGAALLGCAVPLALAGALVLWRAPVPRSSAAMARSAAAESRTV